MSQSQEFITILLVLMLVALILMGVGDGYE